MNETILAGAAKSTRGFLTRSEKKTRGTGPMGGNFWGSQYE